MCETVLPMITIQKGNRFTHKPASDNPLCDMRQASDETRIVSSLYDQAAKKAHFLTAIDISQPMWIMFGSNATAIEEKYVILIGGVDMATSDSAMIRKLNRLHRICVAGELGFEVVAKNLSNRGLKVVIKSYAQQRTRFAAELKEEIERLGGQVSERRSIRGVIHRGRIDIFAALTIGPYNVERTVLSEAVRGENAAVSAYRGVIDGDMPAETREIVQRQYEDIQAARDRLVFLRGDEGEQLVVRLFDTEQDAETATRALQEAGFDPTDIEVVDVKDVTSVYEGEGSKVSETVASGAFGGAIWGAVIGAAAGLGIILIPGMEMMMMGPDPITSWIIITLVGTVVGALFGAILGFFIGHGASEEDTYVYDVSVRYGTKLVRLRTTSDRAMEATRVCHGVSAAARARVAGVEAPEPEELELTD